MRSSALPSDATIGERLRRLRTERGLTQDGLAERAGLSVDIVKKLEQGQRASARVSTLTALADALDVTLADLTDKRPRLNGGSDRLVLELRDTLLTPAALPGFDLGYDDGVPAADDVLQDLIGRGWASYWRGDFAALARELPGLIGETRVAAKAGGATAARALGQAYQLAACLLVHLGRDDLAAVAAERGITANSAGGDELQNGALYGTYAWVMLHQGRAEASAQLAARAAAQIEPRLSQATPEQVTVWGGLLITALASAAAAELVDDVEEYLRLAGAGAARAGRDRRDYEITFGPTEVAVQSVHARMMLRQPDRALAAASRVRTRGMQTIARGRHLIDVAQAQVDLDRTTEAVTTLEQAKGLAPVWFRHQGPARALVADLAERQRRLSPALRDLVQSLEPQH
jgi:transcriptional regulator with XRE-family HTH domain